MAVLVGTAHSWFRGVDVILELFSFIIALSVAFVSYKVYKTSKKRRFLAFSIAFVLLGASFIARMVSELLIYLEVLRDASIAIATGPTQLEASFIFGRFIYITVVFVAYWVLAAIALKIDNKRTLTLVSLLLAVLAWYAHLDKTTMGFHIVNLIFLTFVASHFLGNYLEKRSSAALFPALAFLTLIVESITFLAASQIPILYVAGYAFRFIGYGLLLTSMIRVLRA